MTNAGMNAQYLSSSELHRLGLKSFGEEVLIHKTVVIVCPDRLTIGSHVRIDPFTVISTTGQIWIADYVHVAAHCSVAGAGTIRIDSFSTLSHGVRIFTSSDDYSGEWMTNSVVPTEYKNVTTGPVIIDKHVIIGAGTVILPNCHIGEGAAVGAQSLVKSSLDQWTIYAGVPVVARKTRSRAALDLERKLRNADPD